jgi:hypothetical protein
MGLADEVGAFGSGSVVGAAAVESPGRHEAARLLEEEGEGAANAAIEAAEALFCRLKDSSLPSPSIDVSDEMTEANWSLR